MAPGAYSPIHAEFTPEIDSPAEGRGFAPSVPRRIDDALKTSLFACAALPVSPDRPTRLARGTGSSNPLPSAAESCPGGARKHGIPRRNRSTRRAYENAIHDFMRFTGIVRPQKFRTVTRAHITAARLVVGPDDVRDVGVGNERY